MITLEYKDIKWMFIVIFVQEGREQHEPVKETDVKYNKDPNKY